jgi:hypothetical protein
VAGACKGAELLAVQNRRPLGVRDPISDDAIWRHVGENLSKQTVKESATAFRSSVSEEQVKTAGAFQAGMRTMRGVSTSAGQEPQSPRSAHFSDFEIIVGRRW